MDTSSLKDKVLNLIDDPNNTEALLNVLAHVIDMELETEEDIMNIPHLKKIDLIMRD